MLAFVGSPVAAGYTVFAVNPMSVSRYRERHSTSGAKSDPGDARVLAELARTDHHNHRPVAGDSELVESIKVLTRAHQSLIWTRQRQHNQLRSTPAGVLSRCPGSLRGTGQQRRPRCPGRRAVADELGTHIAGLETAQKGPGRLVVS